MEAKANRNRRGQAPFRKEHVGGVGSRRFRFAPPANFLPIQAQNCSRYPRRATDLQHPTLFMFYST